MVFSAVALVAFSFAGMANTEMEVFEKDLKNGLYDCIDYANDQVDAAQNAVDFVLSEESENAIWLDAMNNCNE